MNGARAKRLEPVMTVLLDEARDDRVEYIADRRTAARVNAALKADPRVPDSVRAAIRDGQAFLEGTTDQADVKLAAETVAGAVDGVVGVLNLIGIRRSA
jgi:osmotically-inducible protein OsmY